MGSYVDVKKLKIVFVFVLIMVMVIADVAYAAYLINDDFKVISVNDYAEDYCNDGYRVEVAEEIERVALDGDSSRISLPIDGIEPSTSSSSKKTLNTISDEKILVITIVLLDVAILISGFLLYFVVKNAKLGNRGAVAGWGTALGLIFLISIFVLGGWHNMISTKPAPRLRVHAPIIYLYDEQCRDANVKLRLNGELTCTYPVYDAEEGWNVRTSPDGILTDENGRQYEYLFWEGDVNFEADFSKGFCVAGKDTVEFLEKALTDLGLSDTEANAFIMYWLPQMEGNEYNVISFQTENFENAAVLEVTPAPDTVVRVSMLFKPSDEYVEMEPQDLASMNTGLSEREGFVLVEWGGGMVG